MEFIYEKNRIYIDDENGKTVAEIIFSEREDGAVEITHTIVDNSLQGQGVAGKLMERATEYLKSENKKIVPVCSYAVKWFEKNGLSNI